MNKLTRLNLALKHLNAVNISRHCSSLNNTRKLLVQPVDNHRLNQPSYARIHHSAFKCASASAAQPTEKVVGNSVKYDFLAETKQLLNIVAKSLYSEKEVFVRELISNASDAIEKLKYLQLTTTSTGTTVADSQVPFEIRITANDINNTLIIQVS